MSERLESPDSNSEAGSIPYETPPPPVEEDRELLSLQELHERTMRFGPLAPLVMSLAACASIEQRHNSGIETHTYEDIPEHVAEQFQERFGFTRDVAERCYLQLDPAAVGKEDTPPVLMIGQIHPPTAMFDTISAYEQASFSNVPRATREKIREVVKLLPYSQEAIRDLLQSMHQNTGERVTIFDEGTSPMSTTEMANMRGNIGEVQKVLENINDVDELRQYWEHLKNTHAVTNAPPSINNTFRTTFTSQAIHQFLDHLRYHPIPPHQLETAERLQYELKVHPHVNMTKEEWAWYVGASADAYAQGWVDLAPADVDDDGALYDVFAEVARSKTVTPNLAAQYYALQEARDQRILERVHDAGGGVLVMGLKHSYKEKGAVTCIPRLGEGASYDSAGLRHLVGSLGK